MFVRFFKTQTVLIKLVLPQAAQLRVYFIEIAKQLCSTSLRDPFNGILLKVEGEKSPALSGNRTHDVSVMRHVLVGCATAPALISFRLG